MSTLIKRSGTAIAWMLSFVLIGIIAFIYMGPKLIVITGLSPNTLPKVNAVLNGLAAVALICGWVAIMKRKIPVHRAFMLTAVAFSVLFLVSYVIQHGSFPSVKYGGALGWLYYPVLLSHIVLAAAIVPLVLITLVRALSERFDKHRKIARCTLPLWLYVSITGVVVYLMCAPYY